MNSTETKKPANVIKDSTTILQIIFVQNAIQSTVLIAIPKEFVHNAPIQPYSLHSAHKNFLHLLKKILIFNK